MSVMSDGWAIIPAAGVGSRLRPHTHTTPKPLLHVAGKPILGYILDEVVRLGIRKIALVIGPMGEQIIDFAETKYPDCEVLPVPQDEPQGLGHAVFLARERTEGLPLLIIYGDTVFEGDLSEPASQASDGVIGIRKVEDPSRFGVVEVENERIVGLVEKPDTYVSDLAIVGINFIRNSSLLFSCLDTMIQKNRRTRGEYQLTDAFSLMVESGAELKTFLVDNWFDCGAPESLLDTNRHLLGHLSLPGPRENTVLVPPVFVAESASVSHSVIGPYVSVGDGAVVQDALIRDSIIGEGAHVSGCFLERSLVGAHALVKEGPRTLNVGDSSEVRLY